jgi:UPF0271 protein
VQIDLNADMGESFGLYQMGNDDAFMKLITSANIACGFHAGDPTVMKTTVRQTRRGSNRGPSGPSGSAGVRST